MSPLLCQLSYAAIFTTDNRIIPISVSLSNR